MRRMVVSLSPIEATCGGSGSQFQQAMRTHAYQMLRGRPSSMSSSTKLTLETVRRSISRADSRDPNFSMAKTFVGGYGLDLHYDRRLNNPRALFRQRDGAYLVQLQLFTNVGIDYHYVAYLAATGHVIDN